jgi:hypothetical protein
MLPIWVVGAGHGWSDREAVRVQIERASRSK